MKKEVYLNLVEKHTPKERSFKSSFNAFIMGGTLGFIGEAIKLFLVNEFQLTARMAVSWVLLIFIFIASLLTALGVFDKILINDSINELNDLEKSVINYRYFSDLTQDETANVLGISQVKVSRVEAKSKKKIKEYIAHL